MKAEPKEVWKFITEFFYYLLGVALDGGKDKEWKGSLFVWPFIAALLVIVCLIAKVFMAIMSK